AGQPGGVAVSTLREAEYFVDNGILDIQYAVGIVPDRLERVAALLKRGASIQLITDNPWVASAVGEKGRELGVEFKVLIEIDTGEERSGVFPNSPHMIEIAKIINGNEGSVLEGVMTHAGHSYKCTTIAEIVKVAEAERDGVVEAARILRDGGMKCPVVSVGSTPTALYAENLEGVTEARAGVYMFGDMFQAQINSCSVDDLAVSVLSQVTGHRSEYNRLLIDAGALALSKDRSTENVANDVGFGMVADISSSPFVPQLNISRVYQEHGQVEGSGGVPLESMPIGSRVRVLPNHVCMTSAMYCKYYVIDSDSKDDQEVVAEWSRINGW
ncbi:MAG: alanine racemase, partial [Rhodospirillaceae bacterium]|nr:alanine racemase [Rhodospirillaceae bacterium]